jgi:hypothetical protein
MTHLTNDDAEFMNLLAREFNAPYVEAKGDLPAVQTVPRSQGEAVIREEATPLDAYPLAGAGLLRDTEAAPVLSVRQAG